MTTTTTHNDRPDNAPRKGAQYDAARVEGAKTLGDAYRHYRRDPAAFVAGVQYALDKVVAEVERMGVLVDLAYVDHLAATLLERAKAGEPQ